MRRDTQAGLRSEALSSWLHAIAAADRSRAIVALLLVLGCGEQGVATPSADAPAVARSVTSGAKVASGVTPDSPLPGWSPRPLSHPGAFDLALHSDGAALVWSSSVAKNQRSALWVQRFARDGRALSVAPQLLHELDGASEVVEVAAAGAAGRFAVAWVARTDGVSRAWVAHGNDAAGRLTEVELLGAIEAGVASERGRVLVAAGEDGELQVTWRGERAACEAQSGQCSHYSRRSVTRGSPDDRGSIARELTMPCDPLLIGSLWSDGSWYEAVCHLNPGPAGYLFSFRPAISYAEATEHFNDCAVLGLSRLASGAALWSQCGDGVAVATRSHDPALHRSERGVERVLTCVAGRPRLFARAGAATVADFALGAPSDALGSALPEHIAPIDARAVWTGSALLIAQRTGDEARVAMHVVSCDGEQLRQR